MLFSAGMQMDRPLEVVLSAQQWTEPTLSPSPTAAPPCAGWHTALHTHRQTRRQGSSV